MPGPIPLTEDILAYMTREARQSLLEFCPEATDVPTRMRVTQIGSSGLLEHPVDLDRVNELEDHGVLVHFIAFIPDNYRTYPTR
ncbi:hypothetical protein [Rhodococcus qingshengii]|uniref:hypothetical protein n=1 Tax=Rhodococcus qingshengii TaxID=334542 RepID=UPI0035DF1FE2